MQFVLDKSLAVDGIHLVTVTAPPGKFPHLKLLCEHMGKQEVPEKIEGWNYVNVALQNVLLWKNTSTRHKAVKVTHAATMND